MIFKNKGCQLEPGTNACEFFEDDTCKNVTCRGRTNKQTNKQTDKTTDQHTWRNRRFRQVTNETPLQRMQHLAKLGF